MIPSQLPPPNAPAKPIPTASLPAGVTNGAPAALPGAGALMAAAQPIFTLPEDCQITRISTGDPVILRKHAFEANGTWVPMGTLMYPAQHGAKKVLIDTSNPARIVEADYATFIPLRDLANMSPPQEPTRLAQQPVVIMGRLYQRERDHIKTAKHTDIAFKLPRHTTSYNGIICKSVEELRETLRSFGDKSAASKTYTNELIRSLGDTPKTPMVIDHREHRDLAEPYAKTWICINEDHGQYILSIYNTDNGYMEAELATKAKKERRFEQREMKCKLADTSVDSAQLDLQAKLGTILQEQEVLSIAKWMAGHANTGDVPTVNYRGVALTIDMGFDYDNVTSMTNPGSVDREGTQLFLNLKGVGEHPQLGPNSRRNASLYICIRPLQPADPRQQKESLAAANSLMEAIQQRIIPSTTPPSPA